MAFWGHTFIFDNVPCTEYGLMIYSFDSNKQEDVTFPNVEVHEDRISGRYDALMYGVTQNNPLEYALVFGANPCSVDAGESIDRFEVEAITSWLTGHQERKWLTIVQDDTESLRYKCLIKDLKLITYGDMPWAFSCTVNCDSPFAYTYPQEMSVTVSGTKTLDFFNRSSYNGYYCPDLEIELNGSSAFSIENVTDGNRLFRFSNLPFSSGLKIKIDNKNMVITNSNGINLYPYFNMKFFRLIRGVNRLRLSGNATVKFICEFPVNIGG